MKRFLMILVIFLLIPNLVNAEIIFRATCDSPKGKHLIHDIKKIDNTKELSEFVDDQFLNRGKIELIYDSSKPDRIQLIWGKDNELFYLDGYNDKFFHWGTIKKNNNIDGFIWDNWSFSLPNMFLIYSKGDTHDHKYATGISSLTFYSKCVKG